MLKKIIHIFFIVCVTTLSSQQLSNLKIKTFDLKNDTIKLDSLSIIEESVKVYENNKIISPSKYTINDINALLIWKEKPKSTHIKIIYRTYPFKFNKRVFTNDFQQYKKYNDSTGYLINTAIYKNSTKINSLIDFGKLSYDGDFSRGVSFGNGQDLNLNSSFNLQLAGMLSKDIEIQAAITDNNIPIQAEGNTAKIQDFDKIYIQLKYKENYLKVGDFDIKSPSSYFMKFNKNLQGISYWGEQKINDNYSTNSMASIAIAKGNYAVNNLIAQEGNQGPYKLEGANKEAFIIVISGSEQVFINGEKIQRGASNDYVIDYNLGEISFTSKKIITKDMRIKIEFEYADKNYLRFLYHLNAGIKNKTWSFNANFYSEQDIKSQTINQELSDEKKLLLASVGDSIENAFFSGATETDFSNNRVLYNKIDTIINAKQVSFYKYSTDSTKQLYTLNFSYVGENKGNYTPIQSVANGRVFEWQAPDDFENLQGSYKPVVLLITPKTKQLFTTNFNIKATKNTLISTEFALSNVDVNTFSAIDDKDDKGIALNFKIADKRIFKDTTKQFFTTIAYEFKQDKFIPLERYRNIEFERNWNLENINFSTNEHLGYIETKFLNTKKGNISYRISFLNKDTIYNGLENNLSAIFQENDWLLSTNNKWLISKSIKENTNFIRPQVGISKSIKQLKHWSIGLNAFNEINMIKNVNTDTLLNNSFWWQDYTANISSPDSLKNKYSFIYNLRFEHLPNSKSFNKAYLMANTFSFEGKFLAKKNHKISWNLTYRNLQQDSLLKKNDDLVHFYLGKIAYNFAFLKGVFRGNTAYEIGSGREQKMQYNYVEAPDGQGNYAWQDLNNNSIQELNEFYVSSFQNENRYLRLISNSLEFQAVNFTKFNQRLNINPKAIWFNKKGIRGFIARFSMQTNIMLNKKIFAGKSVKFADIINPVSLNSKDTLLVSNQNMIRNTIFFNRTNTVYAFNYAFKYNEGTTLLTSGFEKRKLTTHAIKARWNINKSLSFISVYTNGHKKNDSDFYFDRKYAYIMNEVENNFKWLLNTNFRLNFKYKYAFRSNPMQTRGGQFAVINETGIEAKYTKAGNFNVVANFTYSSVAYNDSTYKNEQLQIDMLQGLQNGNNYLWSISFDKTIAKNFQISLIYDGRKTGDIKIIHTGRAQVRALF